jgi:SAM-dependent methyltransferase
MAHVEEPIVESAPLARWIAERLCRQDSATEAGCSWYHGFWQFLRVLDLVTTPAHHAGFFRDALQTALGGGSRLSVLISGAIDYSMLAHVLWACGLRGAAAEITVVDICDTPLFLNHWYARRTGTGIRTIRSNILGYQSAERYDVVCTHSFLGQFSPPERRELMAKWQQLLKPGGRAITVNRIRPRGSAGQAAFSPEQAQALREAVLRASGRLSQLVQIGAEDLARYAEAYASRRRPHPVNSREEFAALFEQAGFFVDHLSSAPVAAAHGEQLSGPTTPGGAEYAHIVACRP